MFSAAEEVSQIQHLSGVLLVIICDDRPLENQLVDCIDAEMYRKHDCVEVYHLNPVRPCDKACPNLFPLKDDNNSESLIYTKLRTVREFLDPKKKKKNKSWLEDSRIVDSLDGSDEIEYFDTFPTLEELEYHEWLLKYPKPSWVKAKIRTGNLNNIKISCKMGHFLKRQAYIDLESPINVMSKQHYNGIMNKGLELRQKPSNPSKNNNFVGRVRGLKVFVGNFTYECNFMILEDTTSIIDHHLGEVVFGKPFARKTGLVYDQEEGTVTFEKDDEKITFKMSHKMEAFYTYRL
ncbi:protein kinase-like domain, concanavalin A-like lectin/glucanase domain protein [Tanacetum coccineum]